MWKNLTSSLLGFSYAIRSLSQALRIMAVTCLVEQDKLSCKQAKDLDNFKDEMLNS